MKKIMLFYLTLMFLINSETLGNSINQTPNGISVVVIDPGHGGRDPGAVSGRAQEKGIVLDIALKLGNYIKTDFPEIKIIYTRNSDIFIPLYQRAEIANKNNADLFISIHGNSVAESTDSTKINGLTVWYKNVSSKHFADFIFNRLYDINPLTNRAKNTNQSNALAVIRPYWTPSVIIETSFITNIDDFSWMIRESEQDKLADAIANGIVDYYRN